MSLISFMASSQIHYKIAENISLESIIPLPKFDIDSIESYSYYANGGRYSFIKDHEGRIFFFCNYYRNMSGYVY